MRRGRRDRAGAERARAPIAALAASLALGAAGTFVASAAGAPAQPETAYQHLESSPQYSTYLKLAQKAGITPLLRSRRERTFLVPPNGSFRLVHPQRWRSLLRPASRGELRRLLSAMVLDGDHTPAELRAMRGRRLRTTRGHPMRIERGLGGRIQINHVGAYLSRTHTDLDNGRLYSINAALLEPEPPPATAGARLAQDGTTISCPNETSSFGALPAAGERVLVCDPEDGFPTRGSFDVTALPSEFNFPFQDQPNLLMYIAVEGGAGGMGEAGSAGGAGGVAITAVTQRSLVLGWGTGTVFYYLGEPGGSPSADGASGGGGAATLVLSSPSKSSERVAPDLHQTLAVAGGGGGGGATSTGGGAGGVAVGVPTGVGEGIGADGVPSDFQKAGKGGLAQGGAGGSDQADPPGNGSNGRPGIGGFGGWGSLRAPRAAWTNQQLYDAPIRSIVTIPTDGQGGHGIPLDSSDFTACNDDDFGTLKCGGGGGGGFGGGGGGAPVRNTSDDPGGGGGGGSLGAAATSSCPAFTPKEPVATASSTADRLAAEALQLPGFLQDADGTSAGPAGQVRFIIASETVCTRSLGTTP